MLTSFFVVLSCSSYMRTSNVGVVDQDVNKRVPKGSVIYSLEFLSLPN